jgi:hypothetical protein
MNTPYHRVFILDTQPDGSLQGIFRTDNPAITACYADSPQWVEMGRVFTGRAGAVRSIGPVGLNEGVVPSWETSVVLDGAALEAWE